MLVAREEAAEAAERGWKEDKAQLVKHLSSCQNELAVLQSRLNLKNRETRNLDDLETRLRPLVVVAAAVVVVGVPVVFLGYADRRWGAVVGVRCEGLVCNPAIVCCYLSNRGLIKLSARPLSLFLLLIVCFLCSRHADAGAGRFASRLPRRQDVVTSRREQGPVRLLNGNPTMATPLPLFCVNLPVYGIVSRICVGSWARWRKSIG